MQDFNINDDVVETTVVHTGSDDFSALTPVLGAVNDNMRWARVTSAFSQGLSSIEKVLVHSATEETKRQHSKDRRDERIEKIQAEKETEIETINNRFALNKFALSVLDSQAADALRSGDNKAFESVIASIVEIAKANRV